MGSRYYIENCCGGSLLLPSGTRSVVRRRLELVVDVKGNVDVVDTRMSKDDNITLKSTERYMYLYRPTKSQARSILQSPTSGKGK